MRAVITDSGIHFDELDDPDPDLCEEDAQTLQVTLAFIWAINRLTESFADSKELLERQAQADAETRQICEMVRKGMH